MYTGVLPTEEHPSLQNPRLPLGVRKGHRTDPVLAPLQGGPVARGKDGQVVLAAAQHPPAGGGGYHRSQPVPPVTAPQQGHPHEDAETGCSVHLVRPQAARGGSA